MGDSPSDFWASRSPRVCLGRRISSTPAKAGETRACSGEKKEPERLKMRETNSRKNSNPRICSHARSSAQNSKLEFKPRLHHPLIVGLRQSTERQDSVFPICRRKKDNSPRAAVKTGRQGAPLSTAPRKSQGSPVGKGSYRQWQLGSGEKRLRERWPVPIPVTVSPGGCFRFPV